MKKLFVIFAAAALMAGFTSCGEKDCTCTFSEELGGTSWVVDGDVLDAVNMSCKEYSSMAGDGATCK